MLLRKFINVGFTETRVVERKGFSLADLTRYPLFAPDFIDFMRRVMPPERHAELVLSVAVTARKPWAAPASHGADGFEDQARPTTHRDEEEHP